MTYKVMCSYSSTNIDILILTIQNDNTMSDEKINLLFSHIEIHTSFKQGCYSAVVDYFETYIYMAGALAIVVLTIEVRI